MAELAGHEIKGYTMGSAIVLRCECGWERGGTDWQRLADQAAAHLAAASRKLDRKRVAGR